MPNEATIVQMLGLWMASINLIFATVGIWLNNVRAPRRLPYKKVSLLRSAGTTNPESIKSEV
jgi:hypothetical protein